jgi:ABC-2 type transport system permease protein
MAILILAAKDLRLLLRDRRALTILLAMPVIFILILGLLLGEGFGQKPDNRLRVSIVDLDEGNRFSLLREATAPLIGLNGNALGTAALIGANRLTRPPDEPWSQVVLRDLKETANIRVEVIPDRATAGELVRDTKRSAVLVFQPTFSEKVTACSFLADGINPFYREGVDLTMLDSEFLRDPTQKAAASIIEQVAQVAMLRVVLPWMIGRAFEKLSEPQFIELLGNEVRLPVPKGAEFIFKLKGIPLVEGKASLNDALRVAASDDRALLEYRNKVGQGVQVSLAKLFAKYNLTGKSWAALTKSQEGSGESKGEVQRYVNEGGIGPIRRGAALYQTLVPSYTVMFAFFLVLTVSWLFVSERRQGTLKRLRVAPITRTEILLGKLLPCYCLSVAQGMALLGAGRLVFGMKWGPEPILLLPVVMTTSLAAMGMALFVATLARTEAQVAIYGTLLVLVLGFISGCIVPRALMPEEIRQLSLVTPHAWALDAYAQLLLSDEPNYRLVAMGCGMLVVFGAGFVGLAWYFLDLD